MPADRYHSAASLSISALLIPRHRHLVERDWLSGKD